MNLGKFSVGNPVLINILMVLILVFGFFSVSRLPQEQFSDVPFFFVNIAVPFPGVSAADIERTVTVRVENAMQGVDRIDRIRSVTTEGLSRVTLEFDQGISRSDFDRLFQEVRNRFNAIDLPDGVLQESISEFTSNDFVPVIEVVLSGSVEYDQLNRAARELRDRLEQIRDVSGVTLVGARDRQVLIEADPQRLESIGVSLDEVVRAVRGRNVTVPGGQLDTPSRTFLLRTVGEIEDYRDFSDIIVRKGDGGRQGVVTVGDVAGVSLGFDREGIQSRFNGTQSITLRVLKVPGGSSVGIAGQVRGRTAAFQGRAIGDGIAIDYANDSTVPIRSSIDILVTNAVMGLVLLVGILLIFVGLRNALMTALGIPLTFAITFIILEATGETLNGNTLFGMVLVLGLIVDHAIVIVENSYRLQAGGMSRHDAAIKGVNQVIVPVIAATLTTVAAFLPLTFLPGVIGRFLRVVPLTVSIALVASTVEAGLFLPSHFADWPGGRKQRDRKRFARFQDRFARVLRVLYRRRLITVGFMVVIMVASFAMVGRLGQNLFAADDAPVFFADITMPAGTPIDRTAAVVSRVEGRLLPSVGNGDVVSVRSSVGFAAGSEQNVTRANVGQVVVDLVPESEGRERSVAEIMSEMERLVVDIPGPDSIRFRKQATGPPTDPAVVFRLFGDNYDNLVSASEAIKAHMAQYPEIINIRDNLEQSSPELRVTVNDPIAAGLGLSRQAIGTYIRGSFDGINAGTIFTDNEETSVLVRFAQQSPAGVEQLQQISIPTPDGRRVPFSSVAQLQEGDVFASIRRLDGRREVTIQADALTTTWLRELDAEVRELFASELADRYPDVELVIGGEFAQIARLLFDILRVFLIGVFLIYTILGTQFKSYTQPLLILVSVPFAFVGVILFLVVGGQSISTTIIYAGVALAGIAVNDTIVLISFINELRAEGMAVAEAVIEATSTRLRPIILTSLTTIAGLMPTAIGIGGRSVIWGPMASTIIFGLLFSTITALVVVPCVYGLFYDRKRHRTTAAAA
ncbi:MAG: efflux RND transporter permease subunit [Spirochaetaceae bacterium]|nr:MAG: efflux RND transporter permease subunit [Spirochaetaceae bacterium]